MYSEYENGRYLNVYYNNSTCPSQNYARKCEAVGTWTYKLKCFLKRAEFYKNFYKLKSCQSWGPYITTTVCTACMAAGMGNLYRLPQMTFIRGGLPFLTVYVGLTIFVGLPLLFLELGIGQLAQGGVIKSWRVVPFFKGVGYVKLLACCMLSIYYPLYMGLAFYYIIWILKGPIPFQECSAGVRITKNGYATYGKNGQQCLRATFLKNPIEDPYWYGIFAGLLLLIWIIITMLSIRKTRSYIKALIIMLIPTLGCHLFLFIKSLIIQEEYSSLTTFFNEADWSLLESANIWYYAGIQVFFSTSVGFGSFVTNAGILYNKVNPFWTGLGYIVINILFGFSTVIVSQSLINQTNVNTTANEGDVAELYLASLIYNIGSSAGNLDLKIWSVVFYLVILLSGFISMATLTYTLLKALTVQSKNNLKWWHASIVLSFIGYISGCLVLLQPDFEIVHLLDHYIIGNLILITTVIEILALIAFYGDLDVAIYENARDLSQAIKVIMQLDYHDQSIDARIFPRGMEKIKSDFEFMLGHILCKVWLVLWWIIPLFLTAIFAWAMITLPLEGIYREDASWLYGVGWGIVLSATVFIFSIGIYVVTKQDGYTWKDKFIASVKPSNDWGPKDPMSRHNWIQWNSKAQQGERDFTLRRKGTKDYTRSIKKNKKTTISELSTTSVHGVYKSNNHKQNIGTVNESNIYTEVPNHNSLSSHSEDSNTQMNTLRVTSLPNIDDSGNQNNVDNYKSQLRVTSLPNTFDVSDSHNSTHRRNNNPLAQAKIKSKFEENGTLRKGPYIISDDEIDHICHRKFSEHKEITEL